MGCLSPVRQFACQIVEKQLIQNSLNKIQLQAIADRALDEMAFTSSKKITLTYLKNNESELQKVTQKILLSSQSPWTPTLKNLNFYQQNLLKIFQGDLTNLPELLKNKEAIAAVVLKKNPALLKEARDLIQKIFLDIFDQLKENPLNKNQSFHLETIIGELLAIYPFLRPKSKDILSVPICENGTWTIIDFTVDAIKLTPKWAGSPLTAYGLHSDHAAPLLLFKASTFPTDKGFFLSLITDLNPFASVGALGFALGKKKIAKWLENHTSTSKKVTVYGKSLGGAQSLRTALNFPEKVSKVMSYSAPGFAPQDLKRMKKLEKEQNLPTLNLFCQEHDRVPYYDLGATSGANYYQVVGINLRKGGAAHVDMYSTHEKSIVLQLNPKIEASRKRRIFLTALRAFASLTIFPLLVLIHIIQTLFQKIIKFFMHLSKNRKLSGAYKQ